jgi:two-component system phosphate regulon response regulator PhoB
VLIAEDDQDLSVALRMIFERAGHDVLMARDGRAALDLARRYRPDLVVLDVSMPGVTGLDVCRALRAAPETAAAAILIVSAWASPAHVQTGRDAGADDYIVKPFRNDAMLARAEALLSRAGGLGRSLAPPS